MHSRRERIGRLERLASRQDQVISIEQLYDLGLSRTELAVLVERSYLHRLHRGVYAVGHRRLVRRGWLFAALLACGESSFLSHRTAAGIRGLCGLTVRRIDVTVAGKGSTRRPGLVVHRTARPPHPHDVTKVDGLRVAGVGLLLVQLAATESRRSLDSLIEQAARRNVLNLDRINATIARHPRAHGLVTLRAALAEYQPKETDRSGLERAVAAALAADPTIPPPERNVHREVGGIVWEIDFWWADEGVALEADGDRYHRTPRDKERDRLKDAKLMAHGVTPMRITETRWGLDPRGAMDDLRAILRARRRPPQAA